MQNKSLIRFAQSLIILPVLAIGPAGNINKVELPQNVLVQKLNNTTDGSPVLNQTADLEAQLLKMKGDAIDTYFKEHDMPLEGKGQKMASEAEKNGLDWRLLAAITVRESTGGKHDCTKVEHNAFGWGSCKIGFKTDEAAIETVARNLGGNNPKTAFHYDNKNTIEILHAYNPPSVVPKYAEQVLSIMDSIGQVNLGSDLAISNT
jgi:hypothetical protein